jgi:hypothetical protein
MGRIQLVGIAATAGWLMALACGHEAAGPRPGIAVSLSVPSGIAQPGDTLGVTVSAVPTGDAVVQVIRLNATGLITAADSVRFTNSGAQFHAWTYVLPYLPPAGAVVFTATALGDGVTGTDQDTVRVADLLPPDVTALDATPIVLLPTDTVTVTYSAHDEVGLWWTVVRISGAFTVTDSVDHGFAKQVTRSVRIPVPASTPMGSTFTVKVIAADPALHLDSATTLPVQVTDLVPPAVNATATGPEPILTLVANDTLRVAVNATDNYKLAWLGYRLGPPASLRDSVAITGRNATQNFTLLAASAWIGSQTVTAFARDSAGHLSETALGTATVIPGVRRPTYVFPLDNVVPDLAYDSSRDVVYFSEPDADRVSVFSLATRQFAAPIALFSRPVGLDVTPGGDSLLVALRLSTSLAIINLQNGHVDTVTLPLNPNLNPGLDRVRVMANGMALVTTVNTGVGDGELWEYDLIAQSRRKRTDAGVGGQTTGIVPMARAGNRSSLLMILDNSCCPEVGMIYSSATDTIAIHGPTADRFGPKVSADRSGSLFLVDQSLFDGSLNLLRTFTSSAYTLGASSALSADGQSAYLAIGGGYLKARTSDGVVVDTVRTGQTFDRFIAVASGSWLVGVAGNPQLGAQRLVLVDLR